MADPSAPAWDRLSDIARLADERWRPRQRGPDSIVKLGLKENRVLDENQDLSRRAAFSINT
jgi:hypothetical protein